jgi:hypothetical protein
MYSEPFDISDYYADGPWGIDGLEFDILELSRTFTGGAAWPDPDDIPELSEADLEWILSTYGNSESISFTLTCDGEVWRKYEYEMEIDERLVALWGSRDVVANNGTD